MEEKLAINGCVPVRREPLFLPGLCLMRREKGEKSVWNRRCYPLPQGDVTLEELKDALRNTIRIDGIPMLLFLPQYLYEELEEFTKKVLNLFSPNLILGISNEISPPGDIEKVRFVSQIVESSKV